MCQGNGEPSRSFCCHRSKVRCNSRSCPKENIICLHYVFEMGGTINCRVTREWCYSEDLVQGGLEIPNATWCSQGYREGQEIYQSPSDSDKENEPPQVIEDH